MNLKDKLYQLIISRLDGGKIHDKKYQEGILTLVRKGIGGFIIFGGKREYIRPFIDNLQTIAEIPLFIASDIERGVGQQIEEYTVFPCQMAVRAAINRDNPDDMAILRDGLMIVAQEAIDAGINMPLIPVLDVNNNPDNPIICTRAFSDDPEEVSFFGSEYIRVLEGMGLISCAKHFPGHGDTSIDSHIALPLITKSYNELLNSDIRPFTEAVRTGVSSIMIGHLLIPSIDETLPATLSKSVITDLLRKGLGFNGLIMTDAMNMSALSGIKNAAAGCIGAGVDIILHPSDAELTVRELEDAVRTGMISGETINNAVDRILKAKSKLSQINRAEVDLYSHNVISRRMTEMSITMVNKEEGITPVLSDQKTQLIIAGDDSLCEQSLWTTKFQNIYSLTKDHEDTLPFEGRARKGMGSLSDTTVIIGIFSKVAAWRGTAGIDDKTREQVADLIKKAVTSIVISFGTPYMLRYFKDADLLVAAYEANVHTQEAVLRWLSGETRLRGSIPVKL